MPNSFATARILVVDDNQDLLETNVNLLRTLGFTAEMAANGQEAWDCLEASKFDLVLTDIRMPIMDGVELLRKIRLKHRTSPCVFMTSGFSDYPSDTLLDLGANGFLPKPVGIGSIRDVLARAFIKPEQRWALPLNSTPTQTLDLNSASFDQLIQSRRVRFGNGGFSVDLARPISAHSLISFRLDKIEGVGLVKWAHTATSSSQRLASMGIEIRQLSESSLEFLCGWIPKQNFTAHIPL